MLHLEFSDSSLVEWHIQSSKKGRESERDEMVDFIAIL